MVIKTTRGRAVALPILFVVLGAILYSSGLNAPWYFDDLPNIVENSKVRTWNLSLADMFSSRGVAQLSFQLNYALTGMSARGFRLVNIAIHIAAALFVWRILTRFYRESSLLPLVGALFFLVHPVQTQAVTYIVQRMSSLSTLLVLASVLFYVRYYESSKERWPSVVWYGASVVAAALAIGTKQNAATIPLMLFGLEWWRQPTGFPAQRIWLRLIPFAFLALLAVLQSFGGSSEALTVLSQKELSLSGGGVSVVSADVGLVPLRYFVTQWSVFWVYMKLIFFPVGLHLDYFWPLVDRLFEPWSFLALAGLFALFFGLRLVGYWNRTSLFGLLWIVCGLAAESSFLPLEPVYEHRLYLPMFGIAILAIEAARQALPRKRQVLVVSAVLVILAGLTWQRNSEWRDPVEFWSGNLREEPDNIRVMTNLAKAYADRNDFVSAQYWFGESLKLSPMYRISLQGMGNALLRQNKVAEARPYLLATVDSMANKPVEMCSVAGALFSVGEQDKAMSIFHKALEIDRNNLTCIQNLAVAYDLQGRRAEAEEYYRRGLQIDPKSEQFSLALGVLLIEKKVYEEALPLLGLALRQSPKSPKILYYSGLASCLSGRGADCRKYVEQLRAIDRNYYEKLLLSVQKQ